MQVGGDLVFEFKHKGENAGFLACDATDFIFKPDKCTAVIIPLEILKKNLRLLVKTKRARIIKTKDINAVLVPKQEFINLFI